MSYETIKFEIKDNVAEVTLNRPDALNAMNHLMLAELKDVVRQIHLKLVEARALLITGEGRGFCSGADLMDSVRQASAGPVERDSGSMLMDKYHPLFLDIAALDIPVITAVNGIAAGAGMSLSISADFVCAARSASFLQAFINIGLVPDAGSTWLLPRLIGPARAKRMMMLGEKIPAETAFDWGLCHSLSDDDTLMDDARALAQKLANGPTLAHGKIRSLIRTTFDASYAEQIQNEALAQRSANQSADAVEGVTAFVQKRPAAFKGH